MTDTLPCIVCGAELEPAIPPGTAEFQQRNQPYGGTTFFSHGHYGSTIFDPPLSHGGNVYLELNICDNCLRGLSECGVVLLTTRTPRAAVTHSVTWKPDEEPDL